MCRARARPGQRAQWSPSRCGGLAGATAQLVGNKIRWPRQACNTLMTRSRRAPKSNRRGRALWPRGPVRVAIASSRSTTDPDTITWPPTLNAGARRRWLKSLTRTSVHARSQWAEFVAMMNETKRLPPPPPPDRKWKRERESESADKRRAKKESECWAKERARKARNSRRPLETTPSRTTFSTYLNCGWPYSSSAARCCITKGSSRLS